MPLTQKVPINGDAIRAIRLRSGLTQRQLAKAAKVAQSHISDIENGESPSELVANRLANALAVPVNAILATPTEVTP